MDIDNVIKELRGQGAPEPLVEAFDKIVRPWVAMLDEGKANDVHPEEYTRALANVVPLMVDLIVRLTSTDVAGMRAVWAHFQTEFRDTAETYSARTMAELAARKGKLQ